MNREYRIRYDREYGKFIRTPVYGEGVFSDMMKNIGSKLFGETMKKTVKSGLQKGAEKAFENAAAKTGDYAAKKAGNKIIEMLSKKKPERSAQLSQREIDDRINRILSGGKLRKLM